MKPLGFLSALQFLTRIPVRLRCEPTIGAAVPWFGVVGIALGAVVGGVAAVLMEVLPSTVAAAVAVITGVAMTGAFHEDGLADTADAMGGTTPERRREILTDSRHGSYGVAAMCASIVLRILCLAAVGPAAAFAGAMSAHGLGRASAVVLMGTDRLPFDVGLAGRSRIGLSTRRAAVGVAVTILIVGVAVGWWIVPLAAATIVSTAVTIRLVVRAFGEVGGDALGAVEQVVECVVLVVVSGLAARSCPWWT